MLNTWIDLAKCLVKIHEICIFSESVEIPSEFFCSVIHSSYICPHNNFCKPVWWWKFIIRTKKDDVGCWFQSLNCQTLSNYWYLLTCSLKFHLFGTRSPFSNGHLMVPIYGTCICRYMEKYIFYSFCR